MKKVANDQLLQAALSLMVDAGQALTPISAHHRANVYRTPSGKAVRVRTCNLHRLTVVRTKAELSEAGVPRRLRRVIGATDYMLVATPKVERSAGAVLAFLIPTETILEQIDVARSVGRHDWSIDLDDEAWARYRLDGLASASLAPEDPDAPDDLDDDEGTHPPKSRPLGEVIAEARSNIAAAAHVAESAVKIQIDFG